MIKIFSPSYKRPTLAITHKYIPEVVYVVAEKEAEDYRRRGVEVWAIPDEVQGNISRVRNYILENGGDKVVMIDDDMRHFGRWSYCKNRKLSGRQALEFIEHGFLIAEKMGAHYWGMNIVPDKGAYREYTPFGFTCFIGGPFCAHLKNPCRYDERIPLKEDYDMTLQVLNRFRRVLRFNMFHYVCDQHGMVGGCAAIRTIKKEQEQFDLLQKKWGSRIVRRDGGESKKGVKEQGYDINPIIKIPIKGV